MGGPLSERLRRELDGIPQANGSTAYVRYMWQHVLNCEDGRETFQKGNFALPYVPAEPESFGVPLTRSSKVLDIGCLGGYGMYDFLRRRAKAGLEVPQMIGLDLDLASLSIAERLGALWADGRASFCRATCEALPFADHSVDLVVARLVLPYTAVDRALAEIRRVTRRGGLALIQSHSVLYYAHGIYLEARRPKRVLYFSRAILARVAHSLTGSQPRRRGRPSELAMGRTLLTRMCQAEGLHPLWHGGDFRKPMVLFRAGAD